MRAKIQNTVSQMAPHGSNGKRFAPGNRVPNAPKEIPGRDWGGRDRALGLILSLLPGGDEAGEAFSVLRHAQSFSVPKLPRF